MSSVVDRSFYVYALKDPRRTSHGVFYIGKGQGHRKLDHLLQLDDSQKSKRIGEIRAEGHDVVLEELVTGLTEGEAIRIEAELIASFGTSATGGVLLNVVMPTGTRRPSDSSNVQVPSGIPERAQIGRRLLEEAVLSFVLANEHGVRNVDVARWLDLRSAHGGRQRDYLSYSILGNLLAEGKIAYQAQRYRRPR
ncbi:MAG: GIY-YIG nuclease family protein [Phycisphaerales bacterium]